MKANGREKNGCLSHHSTPVNPPSRDGKICRILRSIGVSLSRST
jgi:hypothetical protein